MRKLVFLTLAVLMLGLIAANPAEAVRWRETQIMYHDGTTWQTLSQGDIQLMLDAGGMAAPSGIPGGAPTPDWPTLGVLEYLYVASDDPNRVIVDLIQADATDTAVCVLSIDQRGTGRMIDAIGPGIGVYGEFLLEADGSLSMVADVTTTHGISLDGSTVTSGDLIKLTALDAVLDGGFFLRCLGGTGSTVAFTIGEGGDVAWLGDLAVNTDKFTVAGSDGDTAIDGTLAVVGAVTMDSTLIATGNITGADITGVDITATDDLTVNDDLSVVDLTSTERLQVSNGYGSTGLTVATGGALSTDGAIITDLSLTAGSAAITQITTTGYALSVDRDLASGSTDSALVYLLQDNTGDDMPALSIKQDGTGALLTAADGATTRFAIADGGAVTVTSDATSGNMVTIDGTTLVGGDALYITVVDGTLTGGNYIHCYDGGATDFTVAEGGNVGITGMVTAASAEINGTITLENDATITNAVNGTMILTEPIIQTSAALDVVTSITAASAEINGTVTLENDATITNAADGTMILTEPIIQTSAALDVIGAVTVGGGAGGTGTTIADTGIFTTDGLASLDGGIDVDGAFTVTDATGAIATTGSSALDGGITVDTTNFTVDGSTGAVATASNVTVGGDVLGPTAGGDAGGQELDITAPAGGTATGAGQSGGTLDLDAGAGSVGVGAVISGAGGDARLEGGAGALSSGATGTGGDGGDVYLTAGAAGGANGGVAGTVGDILISGGAGSTGVTITDAGAATADGLASLDGGIDVDGVWSVTNATGAIIGGAESDITLNTNMFTVDATDGATLIAGLASLNGGIAVDTTNFTVDGTTGAVVTASSMTADSIVCTEGATFGGGAGGSGTTIATTGVFTTDGLASLDGGIDVDGVFTVADTTGAIATTGGSALDGGITVDTTNFIVHGTTGAVTTASSLTADSAVLGGGYGSTGLTIANTGNLQTNGAVTVDGLADLNGGIAVDATNFTVDGTTGAMVTASSATADSAVIGGGYGSTGATINSAGVGQFNGALTTDGILTASMVVATTITIGGGYGDTGTTLGSGGSISTNSTLTVDGASTLDIIGNDTDGDDRIITSADYGTVIFFTANAAIAVTLPANGADAGSWFKCIITVDHANAAVFSAATADTLITRNDTAADSVEFQTGQRIGASVMFISNGTYWIAMNESDCTMVVNT